MIGFTVKGSIGHVEFFRGFDNKVYFTAQKEPQIFQNENLAKKVACLANKQHRNYGPFQVKKTQSC